MMNERASKIIYKLSLPVAAGLAYAISPFHVKLREAVAGRRGWRKRWTKAASSLADRPVWFHVSSVGEFEQAKPVISSLAVTRPDIPVVVSFSSPSGYHFALRKETPGGANNIKFIDYLPVDFARNARFILEALDPRLLVFVKFDLWPNLIWEARRRRVPSVLIDATLSPSSRRTSSAGRRFYGNVYSNIDKIIAISEPDAERFRTAAKGHRSITTAGDTRFDRVMERKVGAGKVGFDLAGPGRHVVICGSTWPRDESRLLPALAGLMSRDESLFAVIAPHEPHENRLTELSSWANSSGFTVARASGGVTPPHPRVVLIDTVGILAESYRMGDAAFVGGGFSTGVHSVIEPAIEGLPVLFGPHHDNSFEALRLREAGAGFTVESGKDVAEVLSRLLADDEFRRTAGAAARAYVESQLGATQKCVAAIADYL
ncbi:MAG: glycosyltransferase N-terminal domain-containing protein [Candidatus Latescibacterota bacterium]|jgi:3-deoxy-D-manno-octulosonic-acid transferase